MNCQNYLGAVATAALAVGCCGEDTIANNTKPNVVIIYADDMGYGDISCQNPLSKIETPNIDKFAREGLRFTDAHSSCGVSSPSRYALLTGNYHWRRMTSIVGAFGESEFVPNEMTMPRMFAAKGYKTAMVGKWHLGWNWDSVLTPEARELRANSKFSSNDEKQKRTKYKLSDFDWSQPFTGGPIDIGFDYYYGDGTINFPPYCWIENDHVVTPPTFNVSELGYVPIEGGGSLREGPAAVDWNPQQVLPTLTRKAVEIIEQQSEDEPFFLYFALNAPHAPILPADEFVGKSKAGYYGDFVVQVDDVLRQVEEALKRKGLSENTIVIFSSDNGAERYNYERIERFGHNSTESLRGVKRDLWEGGHRIPFIIKWQGVIEPNQVSEELISQVDLMATFADIISFETPNDAAVDSYSLRSVFSGEKSPRKDVVHHTSGATYGYRSGDWVLINNHTGSISPVPQSYLDRYNYTENQKGSTKHILYNIKEDKAQHVDLSTKYPERVEAMNKILTKYQSEGRSIPNRE